MAGRSSPRWKCKDHSQERAGGTENNAERSRKHTHPLVRSEKARSDPPGLRLSGSRYAPRGPRGPNARRYCLVFAVARSSPSSSCWPASMRNRRMSASGTTYVSPGSGTSMYCEVSPWKDTRAVR